MRKLIAPAGIILLTTFTTNANADPYRWCAQGMGDGGGTNCYFTTLEQCRATASGEGSFCTPNPFYTGGGNASASQPRRRR